jgi:hypothetical protein
LLGKWLRLQLLPSVGGSLFTARKARLRKLCLNQLDCFVWACECGEWNRESGDGRLKQNEIACNAESALDADAADSSSGTGLKYAGFCSVVLLCCGCSDRCFRRFHVGSIPMWDLGAFGC